MREKDNQITNSANFLITRAGRISFSMHNVPSEQAENLDSTKSPRESKGRFTREVRLSKNGCPLCSFVQNETEKGNPIPVEEWIFLAHLRNVHGIIP
jgi:hypothetical protein